MSQSGTKREHQEIEVNVSYELRLELSKVIGAALGGHKISRREPSYHIQSCVPRRVGNLRH